MTTAIFAETSNFQHARNPTFYTKFQPRKPNDPNEHATYSEIL